MKEWRKSKHAIKTNTGILQSTTLFIAYKNAQEPMDNAHNAIAKIAKGMFLGTMLIVFSRKLYFAAAYPSAAYTNQIEDPYMPE